MFDDESDALPKPKALNPNRYLPRVLVLGILDNQLLGPLLFFNPLPLEVPPLNLKMWRFAFRVQGSVERLGFGIWGLEFEFSGLEIQV